MTQPRITQDNVHILLPNKIAQLADLLLQNGIAPNMSKALSIVYTSPVYANLEQESTKYWWQGTSSLYYDLVATPA